MVVSKRDQDEMLRKLAKKVFGMFGLEISHKLERRSMEATLEHIKRLGFYPKVVLDVGSADGTFPLLDVFPKSEFVWIEPLVEFEVALVKLASKFKGRYLIAELGNLTARQRLMFIKI